MRVPSEALSELGGLLDQAVPDGADLNLLLPAVIHPVVVLRAPASEQSIGARWNRSGIFQVEQDVMNVTSTVTAMTLEKGLWELHVNVSHVTTEASPGWPNPAWAFIIGEEASGTGGELATLQTQPLNATQHAQWTWHLTLRTPHFFNIMLSAMGTPGRHQTFTCVLGNKLLP